jgi:hypothetical protein
VTRAALAAAAAVVAAQVQEWVLELEQESVPALAQVAERE